MTAIEETMMMHANSSSSIMTSSGSSDSISRTDALLNDLPRRSVGERGKSYSPKGQIDIRLALLMKLVERVKMLDQVSVRNIPYLSKSGVIVEIPGPWSIKLSGTSTPNHEPSAQDNQQDDEEEEEDLEEVDDEDDLQEDEEDPEILAALAQLDRKKFVVRNEFGHVRIKPLIEALENSPYGSFSELLSSQLEIGGHCVLSKKDFEHCLERRWGQPHPLSGKFHPIAGTTIPETTLLFYAPRTEHELETVWKIVQASYEWALSDQK